MGNSDNNSNTEFDKLKKLIDDHENLHPIDKLMAKAEMGNSEIQLAIVKLMKRHTEDPEFLKELTNNQKYVLDMIGSVGSYINSKDMKKAEVKIMDFLSEGFTERDEHKMSAGMAMLMIHMLAYQAQMNDLMEATLIALMDRDKEYQLGSDDLPFSSDTSDVKEMMIRIAKNSGLSFEKMEDSFNKNKSPKKDDKK